MTNCWRIRWDSNDSVMSPACSWLLSCRVSDKLSWLGAGTESHEQSQSANWAQSINFIPYRPNASVSCLVGLESAGQAGSCPEIQMRLSSCTVNAAFLHACCAISIMLLYIHSHKPALSILFGSCHLPCNHEGGQASQFDACCTANQLAKHQAEKTAGSSRVAVMAVLQRKLLS